LEKSEIDKEEHLLEVVKKEIWDEGRGYHTLEFPNGKVLEGRFDMQNYLDYYKIPKDLHGKTVVDVGPANGYFSFEMEKRGADVTAIDLFPVFWRDELRELMHSKVNFVKADISKLDESFGQFDIVFCSNMLEHHPNIFGNIENMRKITKGMAIICTEIFDHPAFTKFNPFKNNFPVMKFVGKTDNVPGKSAGTYWKPNMECFIKMAEAAGFKKVEKVSKFSVYNNYFKAESPEGVIHCHV